MNYHFLFPIIQLIIEINSWNKRVILSLIPIIIFFINYLLLIFFYIIFLTNTFWLSIGDNLFMIVAPKLQWFQSQLWELEKMHNQALQDADFCFFYNNNIYSKKKK